MPKKKRTRILAIDPGTREMGIALLEGEKLLYHGVKTFPMQRTPHEKLQEARKTIFAMVRDFRPNVLAVEKAFFANNRNAALLNVLVDEIQAIGRRKRIRVASFAPSTVKKTICENGRASKEQVARAVVSRYPELEVFIDQDQEWREKHFGNMFDAVAIGLTMCARENLREHMSQAGI